MEPEEDEAMGPELYEKLGEEWTSLAKAQPDTVDFLKTSMRKKIGTPAGSKFELMAFFNQKLDINRFFVEDSDGKKAVNTDVADKGMPGVEFGQKEGTG